VLLGKVVARGVTDVSSAAADIALQIWPGKY
jgi:hypothetical protein